MLEQIQGLHLQAKFHLNVFVVSASGGQRQFWAIFDIWGLLYRRPFTDVLLCRLPVAKTHNFWQILTFLGAPVPTAFYR